MIGSGLNSPGTVCRHHLAQSSLAGIRSKFDIDRCPFRKSYPDVLVVQPGQDWDGDDDTGPLDLCLLKTPSAAEILVVTDPNVELKTRSKFKFPIRTRQFSDLPPKKGKTFRPKFTGKLRYKTSGRVDADLTHDLVASELHRRLRKYDCCYSSHNDIFIRSGNGNLIVLFEIKTDCNSTSIYTGVGQLLLNGHAENKTQS